MNTIIKSLRITLLTIVCLLGLGSCTTNNGDIGNLYGRWNLVSVDIDGVEQNEWKQNGEKFCNWYFQNNIVEIQQSDKRHDNSSSYGTWTRGEDSIVFDFTHSDDDTAPGTGVYAPPSWIGFPAGTSSFTIVEDSGKSLVLTTVLENGSRLTYTLQKVM